jgi:hypothetical protein
VRANDGYYRGGPPEEIVHPELQQWLTAHGLRPLGAMPSDS